MTLRKIVIVGLATLVVAGLGAGALVAAHVTRRGVRRVTDLEAALDAARFSIDKARSEAERSGSELVDLEAALEDSEAGIRELKGRIRAGRERTTRLRGELSFLTGVQRDLSRAEDRLLACEDAVAGLQERRGPRLRADLTALLRDAFDAGRARNWATFRNLRTQIKGIEERLSQRPGLDSVTRASVDGCSNQT